MKTATVHLTSAAPYSQSRLFTKTEVPALEKESPADYGMRNWRHHQHSDKDGNIYIPPMALKNALMECAQYLGEKIPGKGQSTWTRFFTAGILCTEPVVLKDMAGKPFHRDSTECETFMCSVNGKRGPGPRVPRTFPVIREWQADAIFYILDETITRDVFDRYFSEAGKFIGVGRFRPRNGGTYGRFYAEVTDWK